MTHVAELAMAVQEAVAGLPDEPLALALSGGLDSSLLALLLKDREDVIYYTVGIIGSRDLGASREAVSVIGIDPGRHRMVEVGQRDVVEALAVVPRTIGSSHPMLVSISVAFYLLCKEVNERVIISGQGADELFGGYARYGRMKPADAVKAIEKDTLDLLRIENMREERLAALSGKQVLKPYLDKRVIDVGLSIPIWQKVVNQERKVCLRMAAEELGLDPRLARLDKKAMQFSTGISKVMASLAKEAGLNERDYLEQYSPK